MVQKSPVDILRIRTGLRGDATGRCMARMCSGSKAKVRGSGSWHGRATNVWSAHAPDRPTLPPTAHECDNRGSRRCARSARTGAARTRSEALFGELAKLVGDRTVISQNHRSISDRLPAEAIADHVHSAVGGPARDPCPGAGPTLFIRQPERELQLHVPVLLKVRHGDGQERDRLLARVVRERRADELLGDFSKNISVAPCAGTIKEGMVTERSCFTPGPLNNNEEAVISLRPRGALIHECHRLWPAHVSRVEMFNLEASTLNDVGDRSVEMTSAGTALPQRS